MGSSNPDDQTLGRWWFDASDREVLASLWEFAITALGFLFLVVFVVELTVDLSESQRRPLQVVEYALWAVFAIDFLARLALSDDRRHFLRGNWLVALSVALPAFRVFRAARAVRAVRSLRLVRVLTTGNRGMRALRKVAGFGGLGYVLGLTAIVLLLASAGIYSLERGAEGSPIQSFGEALWWASTTIVALNSPGHPETIEGRVLGVIVMVYGLGVSGYITAVIAVGLLGLREPPVAEQPALMEELRALRGELEALRGVTDSHAEPPQG